MYALPLSSTSPSRRVGVGEPKAGTVEGNSASKNPSAMWLLGKLGLSRVSPKPATAPPAVDSICSSTKLGLAGLSKRALEQLMPNTTGSCVPFTSCGTLVEDSVG